MNDKGTARKRAALQARYLCNVAALIQAAEVDVLEQGIGQLLLKAEEQLLADGLNNDLSGFTVCVRVAGERPARGGRYKHRTGVAIYVLAGYQRDEMLK